MANETNSIKIATKWFQGEARGRWGITAALLIFFAVLVVLGYIA